MNTAGVWMLVVLAVLILSTGLPVWALLVGVASAFSVLGVVTGVIDAKLLGAAPPRIVGLLEQDLLQALPLYVFVGVLLQRLAVGDAIFSTLARALHATGASVPLAALGTGALVAPMNGSVASSSALLARLVAPRLQHVPPAQATALIAAAATMGVVVPPSLVLILLGDAMMRAHTEASNLPGFIATGQSIINTQNVLNAALLPAGMVLLAWLTFVVLQARKDTSFSDIKQPAAQWNIAQAATGLIAILVIVALLACVFTGLMFAVEAAAAGGCLLLAVALGSRKLGRADWQDVVGDTLSITGALFALLVGATVFSLVFRAWGTDRWLSDLLLGSTLSPMLLAGLILLGVMACAWVLDAFEMIFVIIPIVAPPLIAKLGDAQQAAVLLLLVLQLSFLLPPMGYAVLMARARTGFLRVSNAAIFKQILPYVLIIMAQAAIVFVAPVVVHQLDKAPMQTSSTAPLSAQDIIQQMQDMASQPAAGAKE
jgi:TRAP-type mannitol/chloroaromatic compound transport system permease large subunit